MDEKTDYLNELVTIMARLRAPDGCPWDREQDHRTLKQYLIEETYELIDAIDDGDDHQLRDELGDVLLQVVFHCQIAREEGRFDFQDVARELCEKLVRRHPHVFGATSADDSEQVLRQWEAIKRGERAGSKRKSALDGVPRHLPALTQAEKTQKKAAKLGFDWPDVHGIIAKIDEELAELKEALHAGDDARLEEEIGDLLFSVANLTRYRNGSAEEMLRRTTAKFARRFRHIEAVVESRGRAITDFGLDELDALWEEAKAREAEGRLDDTTKES